MNRFANIQTGQGLLKNNYGPDDDKAGEQLQALQSRSQKLAAKVKATSLQPNLVPNDSFAQQTLSRARIKG